MNVLTKINKSSDTVGSLSSGLCLIHCLVTPFLFAGQLDHHIGDHMQSSVWGRLDLFFIAMSIVAVYWSSRTTTKKWIPYALWLSWGLLALIIINERLGIFEIPEMAIFIPSIALIVLHIYNRKYCSCSSAPCDCTSYIKTKESL